MICCFHTHLAFCVGPCLDASVAAGLGGSLVGTRMGLKSCAFEMRGFAFDVPGAHMHCLEAGAFAPLDTCLWTLAFGGWSPRGTVKPRGVVAVLRAAPSASSKATSTADCVHDASASAPPPAAEEVVEAVQDGLAAMRDFPWYVGRLARRGQHGLDRIGGGCRSRAPPRGLKAGEGVIGRKVGGG